MTSQKEIWNKIAHEWSEFRKVPIKEVAKFLSKQKGKVLDLGSGSGRHLMKIKNGKMYLADFSDEMIKLAKEKSEKEKIPAEFFIVGLNKFPFEKNCFDSAIYIDSLHCIKKEENRKKTIQELYRVLKPRALALISVWNKNSKRFKNSPKERYIPWREKGKRYYYLYNEQEIYRLLKEEGFKIIKKFEPSEKIMFMVQKPQI